MSDHVEHPEEEDEEGGENPDEDGPDRRQHHV